MFDDIHSFSSLSSYTPLDSGGRLIGTGLTVLEVSGIATQNAATISGYNNQLNQFLSDFSSERTLLADKVANGLTTDPNYTGARNDGVNLAWKYEKADIEMGGSGSANWSKDEQQQIHERGTVRGAEGHHQQNVANHPSEQANPDNIKFYKSREEHLMEGHNGDWRNSSDAEMIDKNAMLKSTNNRRVLKVELAGLGTTAAIGLGIGFTLSAIASLAVTGISAETISNALKSGAIAGIESGIIAGTGYLIGLGTGNVLTNLGVDLATLSGNLLNIGAAGLLTIVAVAGYQIIKLGLEDNLDSDTIKIVGRQILGSASLLSVSIIAQGIWGGTVGIIISTSAGLLYYAYNVGKSVQKARLESKIREYTIELYKPSSFEIPRMVEVFT